MQAAGVTCQVSDARLAGKIAADKKTGSLGGKVYEVACGANSVGFLIQTGGASGAVAFSCIGSQLSRRPPASRPSPCILPGNLDLMSRRRRPGREGEGAVRAGQASAASARPASNTFFEVACAGRAGYFVMSGSVPLDVSKPVTVLNCLQTETSASAKCSAHRCGRRAWRRKTSWPPRPTPVAQVKDRRYIGPLTDGTDGYEFACSDGKGYI